MRSFIVFLLLTFSVPAFAVYKCEFGGKVVYGDLPCEHGKTKELSVAAPVSDQEEAQLRLQRDKQQLQELEQRRHRQEEIEQKARQKEFKAHQVQEKKCAALAQRVKWANEDLQQAGMKSRARAQRNAQRASEKYQLACEN